MGILILRKVSNGLYKDIKNFKTSSKPVTQLYSNFLLCTFSGFFDAMLWPIMLPYVFTPELDKLVNYLMNKKT